MAAVKAACPIPLRFLPRGRSSVYKSMTRSPTVVSSSTAMMLSRFRRARRRDPPSLGRPLPARRLPTASASPRRGWRHPQARRPRRRASFGSCRPPRCGLHRGCRGGCKPLPSSANRAGDSGGGCRRAMPA